jgi:hypothetical protein
MIDGELLNVLLVEGEGDVLEVDDRVLVDKS